LFIFIILNEKSTNVLIHCICVAQYDAFIKFSDSTKKYCCWMTLLKALATSYAVCTSIAPIWTRNNRTACDFCCCLLPQSKILRTYPSVFLIAATQEFSVWSYDSNTMDATLTKHGNQVLLLRQKTENKFCCWGCSLQIQIIPTWCSYNVHDKLFKLLLVEANWIFSNFPSSFSYFFHKKRMQKDHG